MRWCWVIYLSLLIATGYSHKDPELVHYKNDAFHKALRIVEDQLHAESEAARRLEHTIDSRPFQFVSSFLDANPYVKEVSLAGKRMLATVKLISRKYNVYGDKLWRLINPEHFYLEPLPGVFTADHSMPAPLGLKHCPYPRKFKCDPHGYRSFDGTCNNLKDGIQGRSMLPLRRILPANYDDGIESMRQSVTGAPLPSPRAISLNLFRDRDLPNDKFTLLLMNLAQFLDHDLTRTAISKVTLRDGVYNKEVMKEVKCGVDGCAHSLPGLEACWPIAIPHDDYDFRFNKCLKFVRSEAVPPLSCEFGVREHMNQLTSWIDASQIYGSTKEEADKLRDRNPHRGRLAVSPHPHRLKPLPPHGHDELCRDLNATVQCFTAGDGRVNDQIGLTAIHTIWIREHNHIEDGLHSVNPHWGGEKLYQETRKIIGAMWQHIAFNEILPLLIGRKVLRDNGLTLTKGFYKGYNPKIDPRPSTGFSTAAYRLGHTLIHESVVRTYKDYTSDEDMMLSQAFHRPHQLYDAHKGGVDALLRGMCEGPCQKYDTFFTKQITTSLFTEEPPHGPGMDLLSLNIQRGRDHGLQGYNAYREWCGLRKAYSFEDLSREIPDRKVRRNLAKIYKTVDDIDLFAGGSSEQSVADGVVGPTFACIIADTFKRVKTADRYWYENDHPNGLTREQLNEIRKMRVSKVICRNGDDMGYIQPWALLYPTRDDDMFRTLERNSWRRYFKEVLKFSRNFENYKQGRQLIRTGPLLSGLFQKHPSFRPIAGKPFNVRLPCSLLEDIDLSKWKQGPYTNY